MDRPVILCIAGSDSSGGAGIAADIRAAHDLECDIRLVVTAVTAQGERGVGAVHPVPLEILRAQMEAGLADGRVSAIKIGMMGSAAGTRLTARLLRERPIPIVLDPVLAASSGGALSDEDGVAAMLDESLPVADIVTPNLPELHALAAAAGLTEPDDAEAALALLARGAGSVLVKGGHAAGESADDLFFAGVGQAPQVLSGRRLTVEMRGTGCSFSTAAACALSRKRDRLDACRDAKAYVLQRLIDVSRGNNVIDQEESV